MKKILFILAIILMFAISAEAKTDKCFWIWSTAVTGANDAPDAVYCSLDGTPYVSKGTSYIQNSQEATSMMIQWDSATGDGANTIGGLDTDITDTTTICSNTATDWSYNLLACISGTCDTGTGTAAYFQKDPDADALIASTPITPPGEGFQLTVDEDGALNGCIVLRTIVTW